MSIDVPVLDTRRFQDIVDEAKGRIPHVFPDWTNHNISDPGVALLELFAWMTEMVRRSAAAIDDLDLLELLSEFE